MIICLVAIIINKKVVGNVIVHSFMKVFNNDCSPLGMNPDHSTRTYSLI
jgi:hypothetical protein